MKKNPMKFLTFYVTRKFKNGTLKSKMVYGINNMIAYAHDIIKLIYNYSGVV